MQTALFHERIEDALDEVARVCGGRKKVACDMWPDKSARDAHNMMDACLNPERRERFTPEQVLYLAKRGAAEGCHAVMAYLGRECGYQVTPITPAEQVDRLTTVIETSSKTLADALSTLARIKAAS